MKEITPGYFAALEGDDIRLPHLEEDGRKRKHDALGDVLQAFMEHVPVRFVSKSHGVRASFTDDISQGLTETCAPVLYRPLFRISIYTTW